MVVNGKIFKNDYKNRQNDFKELYDEVNKSLRNREGEKLRSIYYRPNKKLVYSGHTKGARDNSGRIVTFMYKDTEGSKSAKKMYKDFLKDSENSLKINGYPQGTIDKELREAVKKEIRKQHKIHNIKKGAKITIPILTGGILLTTIVNKNKKKKEEN